MKRAEEVVWIDITDDVPVKDCKGKKLVYVFDKCAFCGVQEPCLNWVPEDYVHPVSICSDCFGVLLKNFGQIGGDVSCLFE